MSIEWVRALVTLLLLALALACWRLLQASPAQPPVAAPKSRKKNKKRAKKPAGNDVSPPSSASQPAAPPASTATAAAAAASPSEDDDSDADNGLSAAQVLARRKFHTTRALGAARAATPAASSAPKFDAGQRVLARFQGGSEWFPATVTEVRRGNEFHLRYDDGEVEFRVPQKHIKPLEPVESLEPAEPLESAEPLVVRESGADDLPVHRVPSSSSDGCDAESAADESDGWEIVGAAGSRAKASKRGASTASAAVTSSAPVSGVGADGLTKRQRESRRKKERQREIKELARAQAQEQGLHARWGGTYSKMKYVPPPSSSSQQP